ncbi:MAG: acylneuraminate cytidylyltransferase family protein [Candidatus Aureabacteria bacterium]|nr:acylneuraminate cytidylyltransferase family protein [Candidatus Auribacterota bacterium]
MKPDILGIIPARGGSKGIIGKNIRQMCGKPLIYYAVNLAQQLKRENLITDYLVSTDSEQIANVVKSFGAEVPFLRPGHLAGDNSPVIDTIIHAVNGWEKNQGKKIHSVLLLQPTNPLTVFSDVEKAILYYLSLQPGADSLISISNAEHIRLPTLYYKKGNRLVQVEKNAVPNVNRQKIKSLFWRNGAIYLSRRDLLLKKKRVLGPNPYYFEMPRMRSLTIDDLFDWEMAEWMMKYGSRDPS